VFGLHRAPHVARLSSRRETGAIILTWDSRGGRTLLWRVLRSERGFAEGAFDHTVVGSGQTLVSDQVRPGSRDDFGALDAPPETAFFTIFCEDERGAWHRQARLKVDTRDPALGRRAEGDFEAGEGRPIGFRDTWVPPPPEHGA
jgi:hypothetical protein